MQNLPSLSEEQKRAYNQMLQTESWRIAVGRLEALSIKKEREKADALRAHSFDLANRIQGVVDGISYAWDTIERAALNEKAAEEEGPIY